MACGNCGHDDSHGRRGYGSCSHIDLTEHGRVEIARIDASTRDQDPIVRRAVLQCALHIPGMTKRCECKRKTKRSKKEGQHGERA